MIGSVPVFAVLVSDSSADAHLPGWGEEISPIKLLGWVAAMLDYTS